MTVPVTDAEGHEFARAAIEAFDRVAALEESLRAVLRAISLIPGGEKALRMLPQYSEWQSPTAERGEIYVRGRIRAVEAGTWGGAAIQRALDKASEDRARAARMAPASLAEWEAMAEAVVELGGTMGPTGARWPRTLDDADGSRRAARARARQREILTKKAVAA